MDSITYANNQEAINVWRSMLGQDVSDVWHSMKHEQIDSTHPQGIYMETHKTTFQNNTANAWKLKQVQAQST